MLKTGRILLLEPEEGLRRRIDEHLERAGHEVFSVPDATAATRLLEDGLEPDVVVARPEALEDSRIAELAPTAASLRIDSNAEESTDFLTAGDAVRCAPVPTDVARRVEEILLGRRAESPENAGERCLEVASRLTSLLREARTPEDRIASILEVLDAYFGVGGSLVARRTSDGEDWVQASQGLSSEIADATFREIARRASIRAVRPFLTRVTDASGTHEIACVPVGFGAQEVTFAVKLEWAPPKASLRQSLVHLVGAAVRAAHMQEELGQSEALLEAHVATFESLIQMAREFTRTQRRAPLCEKILTALRRELPIQQGAVFLLKEGDAGLLELAASSGFAPLRLERIGLSRHHGVGAAGLRTDGITRLAALSREGTAAREIAMFAEVGVRWCAPIIDDGEPLGLLFFGSGDPDGELQTSETQVLRALLGSAAIALRNLRALERLEGLSAGAIRGLVEAYEMSHPEDRGHSDRVAAYARLLGSSLGLDGRSMQSLAIASLLHDIGKIGVARGEHGGLAERRARIHPILGSQILSRAKPLPEVIQAVEQHHERYDGSGHPYGLRGEGIHLFGRIVAIADSYDRSVHHRAEPVTPKEGLQRLQRGAGLVFDPGLVALFSSAIERNPDVLAESRSSDWFLEENVSP